MVVHYLRAGIVHISYVDGCIYTVSSLLCVVRYLSLPPPGTPWLVDQ